VSIKQKIVKGGFYLAMVNIFSQFLSIAVNIILARILMPDDFGLIALSATYIGLITIFTNIGFGSSIIHNQESSTKQISTIYWINFLLSLLTFVIVGITAPLASEFYNESRLTPVVWLSAISILITPIFIIHYKIKERDLEFRNLSRITFISTTSGALSAVFGALIGLGVYALVLQILVNTLIRMILVLSSSKWKPLLVLDFQSVRSMVWYSVKFKLASSVLYFERNIDYLILGKVFSSTVLGYYAFSYNIMYTPVKRISYIFSDVLFPSFSAIKGNPRKIIEGYFKSIQLISIVSFPIMTLLALNAEFIIQFIFGNKWDQAIPLVKILCFAGAIQSISQVGGVIFSSIGKPEINLYFGIVRTSLTAAAIIFGSFHGILAVAWLLLISKALSFVILMFTIYGQIKYSVLDFLTHIRGPLVTTSVLFGLNYILNSFYTQPNEILKLILFIVVVISMTLLLHFKTLYDLYTVIKLKTKTI
jgi:PST family polysaccharide transporter